MCGAIYWCRKANDFIKCLPCEGTYGNNNSMEPAETSKLNLRPLHVWLTLKVKHIELATMLTHLQSKNTALEYRQVYGNFIIPNMHAKLKGHGIWQTILNIHPFPHAGIIISFPQIHVGYLCYEDYH